MILDDKHLVVNHSLLKILLYNWALLEFYLNWKYEKPVHRACTSTNVFCENETYISRIILFGTHMIGIAYGSAPTIPGVYVLTLVILVIPASRMNLSTNFWS